MRDEAIALKWLTLGALSASLPMCDSLIREGDFEDVDGEREVLRSIFIGSFLAAVCSLPAALSDEERRWIVESVGEDVRCDVSWDASVAWFVLLDLEDAPILNHASRTDVFRIHARLLAKPGDPLRGINLAVINMSTRIALRLFSSYLIDFECPEEW